MDPKEQMALARIADPLQTLEGLGYTIRHLSGNEYCLFEHDSLIINPEKGWYWNSRNLGGRSTIDLVMALEGIEKPYEAAKVILGSSYQSRENQTSCRKDEDEKRIKPFILPEKNSTCKRVFAYLNQTRGISRGVIQRCMEDGVLYESKKSHNAVFVGKDKEGVARYAFERGTSSDKRYVKEVFGSKKEHGFRIDGGSDTLHVFESAVDALSFMTLKEYLGEETIDTCLALSGTTLKALDKYLQDHPGKIQKIDVRTDNDSAGRRVFEKIKERYQGVCQVRNRLPTIHKDYNEVLLEVNKSKEWLSREGLKSKINGMIRGDPLDNEEGKNRLVCKSIQGKRKPKDKDYER